MNTTLNSVSIDKRAYERTVWILAGLGCLGLWSGIYLDAQLAGTITYLVAVWAAMGIAFGLPRVTETKLSDERDEAYHNRASGLMFSIAAIATISVVPALYVLDAGGYFTITSTMWGGIYVLSALALLYGLCYGIVLWRN
ncbi:DUF2178 domain-containing protein [Natronococcus sp. A-GB1]|uniref:DUF2178 domain-containing protein n=1 Tax=Natronococcus sp. A-GB1 TaxID=3037648 RepID=UPI00241FC0DC|nr:DUF2178 domain-containing protein [Natronococcus sp. A-GB1]MDG5761516.1 DUF2178 domain-containing protein [Natronococcus sp. A-GB1]